MEQLTDRLYALARAITGTGSGQKADAKLIIRPDVFQVIELPDPLRTVSILNALTQSRASSSWINMVVNQQGANPGVGAQGTSLAAGLWHLKGWVRWQFAGTTAGATHSAFSLVDVDTRNGPSSVPLGRVRHIAGSFLVFPIDVVISLIEAGFNFLSQTGATVVGDSLQGELSLLANRLI